MDHGGPSSGWYADPAGSANLRWWDGYQWTAHLAAYPVAAAPLPQGTPALPGIGLPPAPAGSRQSTGTIVLAALVALVVLCGGLTAVATWPKRPHDETAGPIVAPAVPQGDQSTPTTMTPAASSTNAAPASMQLEDMSRAYAFPAPTDVAGSVQRAGLSLDPDPLVQSHFHVHVEVHLMGGQVTVPAGIGIDPASGAMSPLHTHDDSGIVHIEGLRGQRITLGQLFTEWGQPLGPNSIGNVQSRPGFTVHWFVNGRVVTDPAAVVLQPHDTIVAFETAGPASTVAPPTYSWPSGF